MSWEYLEFFYHINSVRTKRFIQLNKPPSSIQLKNQIIQHILKPKIRKKADWGEISIEPHSHPKWNYQCFEGLHWVRSVLFRWVCATEDECGEYAVNTFHLNTIFYSSLVHTNHRWTIDVDAIESWIFSLKYRVI